MKLGLVGRGRAARTLEPALRGCGLSPSWWWSRGDAHPPAQLPPVDVILMAVSDDAIPSVATTLAQRESASEEVWLHLSGAHPGVAARVSEAIPAAAGALHPLQALPGVEVPETHWHGALAGLDGDALAMERAEEIARALGMRPMRLPPGSKALYHAAAVSVAGHATTLFSLAMETLSHAGFSSGEARDALLPLMRGALDNLSDALPAEAITGPIARGDALTVAAHLKALQEVSPRLAERYRALAQEALALSESSLPSAQAHALRQLLSARRWDGGPAS